MKELKRDRIDVSFAQSPLLVVTFHGVPSDAQFGEYLGVLANNVRDTIRQDKRTALLLDTTHAPLPASATQRKMQAEWLKELSDGLRLACVGTAFVIQSTVVRGAMTAVLWLQDLPYPYTVSATYEAGEAWCIAQLAQAGFKVPPRLTFSAPGR